VQFLVEEALDAALDLHDAELAAQLRDHEAKQDAIANSRARLAKVTNAVQ
jgi:hypothetical protein